MFRNRFGSTAQNVFFFVVVAVGSVRYLYKMNNITNEKH